MIKQSIIIMCALLIAASGSSVNAGFLDDLKDKGKKSTKNVIDKSKSKSKKEKSKKKKSQKGDVKNTPDLSQGPSEELKSLTTCASLKPTNIMTGYRDNYTFQQGMSKEKRSGFIKREKKTLTDGCILPSLQPKQMMYMEVDTKQYEAMGNSNDWEMQCVKSDNLNDGMLGNSQNKTEYPYKVNYLSGKDMMLHCGNSEGIKECESGSNSKRSGAWKKLMKSKGKTMLSIYGTTSLLAPKNGEKLYCQYYNKKSATSLFAFEYIRLQR